MVPLAILVMAVALVPAAFGVSSSNDSVTEQLKTSMTSMKSKVETLSGLVKDIRRKNNESSLNNTLLKRNMDSCASSITNLEGKVKNVEDKRDLQSKKLANVTKAILVMLNTNPQLTQQLGPRSKICPPLPKMENAVAICSSDGVRNIGSKASYICEEGYTMCGEASTKCLEPGRWDAVNFTCEAEEVERASLLTMLSEIGSGSDHVMPLISTTMLTLALAHLTT